MSREPRNWDEDVTDNRDIDKYPGCKDCKFRDKMFKWAYSKCQCDKFVYPDIKPQDLFRHNGKCEYYEKDDE